MPFSLPSVGPCLGDDEEDAYEELRDGMLQNVYSSCIGWVISTVTGLLKEKESVHELKQ